MAIRRFKHHGLERFFLSGATTGIQVHHVRRLRAILAMLGVAESPYDVDLPGSRLHPLKGDRRGYWAVSVSANWRITFRFDGTHVTDVDYEDYH